MMSETTERKNKDYAGGGDAFANFRMCEELGLCSVEKGILVRMSDKMSRIANLLDKEAAVKDESVTDTLLDLAVYSIILKIYMEENQDKPSMLEPDKEYYTSPTEPERSERSERSEGEGWDPHAGPAIPGFRY